MKNLIMFFLFAMSLFANDLFLPSGREAINDRSGFGILIYENPANERAEFEILTPEAVAVTVLVYDSQGNVLFSQKENTQMLGGINSLKINWNLNNRNGKRAASGTYIIQATAKNADGSGIYQYFAHLGVRK